MSGSSAEAEVGVTSSKGFRAWPKRLGAHLRAVVSLGLSVSLASTMVVTALWKRDELARIAALPRLYAPTQLAPFLLSGIKRGDRYFAGFNGQVVIEAEHYEANFERHGQSWRFGTLTTGYSGEGYVAPGPHPGVFHWDIEDRSPELIYYVYFDRPGTYHVRMRGYAEDELSNSVHVGLDGKAGEGSTHLSTRKFNRWTWISSNMNGVPATLEVRQEGFHTVHIWMRENRFKLDRLVLTDSATPPPLHTLYESERITY